MEIQARHDLASSETDAELHVMTLRSDSTRVSTSYSGREGGVLHADVGPLFTFMRD